uniref:COesterase domain-containing protein n=1 Tax=Strongyloides papillosus TaxID=174720 RepID=A0A0N5BF42_STREA
MSILLLLLAVLLNCNIVVAQWPSWNPEVVVINRPTTTENNGIYRRIKYGYYTFPSNSHHDKWDSPPLNPPPAPWPPYPPSPPTWHSYSPSTNW